MEDLVISLSDNFTKIISRDEIRKYPDIDWGDNGIGDRWCGKKFNYTVIKNKGKFKTYSENDEDINVELIENFLNDNTENNKGILGIFVHSKRLNIVKRPINRDISLLIKMNSCVSCGSHSDIICDHKNDIYNDERVLNVKTQLLNDFQPLCNHCNLQKRQVFKDEVKNEKIYSAKNLQRYNVYLFEFPWEKKNFDTEDINTKIDTYWYDPIEFNNKIFLYSLYVIPIITAIKMRDLVI